MKTYFRGFRTLSAVFLLFSALFLFFPPVFGLSPQYLQSIPHNQGRFNGENVQYTAVIEKTFISQGEEGPSAQIVSISYLKENVDDIAGRPVIFIFNGGPIVPSIYLHMAAFGPKRIEFTENLAAASDSFHLVHNKYTVLDAADLVFFDPAGTGFSRVSFGTPKDAYFSVEADAQQLSQFVETWSRNHGRIESPKYLFGESYGTIRAAVAARQLTLKDPPVRLDGVFLMGQALNIIETSSRPGNIISYVVSLPTLAALGWYHGKVEKEEKTLEQFLDEVRLFASTDYLTALFQGNKLSLEEKERIAFKLAAFTGLSPDLYIRSNLRIRKIPFRSLLLQDQNMIIGYYDGRYTAEATDPGENNLPDPAKRINSAIISGFNKYTRKLFDIDFSDYIIDSPVKNLEGWDWGPATPFSDWPYMESVRKAMAANPDLKVVVAAGYYDLTTTIGATAYALSQSGWPVDRVRMVSYEGGHMAYSVEKCLEQMMKDVRTLIAGE